MGWSQRLKNEGIAGRIKVIFSLSLKTVLSKCLPLFLYFLRLALGDIVSHTKHTCTATALTCMIRMLHVQWPCASMTEIPHETTWFGSQCGLIGRQGVQRSGSASCQMSDCLFLLYLHFNKEYSTLSFINCFTNSLQFVYCKYFSFGFRIQDICLYRSISIVLFCYFYSRRVLAILKWKA